MNTPIYVAEVDCTIDVAQDTITPSNTAADNCMTFSQAELAASVPIFPGATQAISIYDSAGSAWAAWRAYWTGTVWEKISTLQERGTLTQPGALVVAVMPEDGIRPNYISGCNVQYVGASAIDIGTGGFCTESGEFMHVAAPVSITGLTGLSANTWYQVYIYNDNGAPAGEVSAIAPAAPYFGKARSKTGDSKRRLIGFIYTDGSGNILDKAHCDGTILFRIITDYNPVSGGSDTAYGSPVPFFPVCANLNCQFYFSFSGSVNTVTLSASLSSDGINDAAVGFIRFYTTNDPITQLIKTDAVEVRTNDNGELYYKIAGSTNSVTIRVHNITWERE